VNLAWPCALWPANNPVNGPTSGSYDQAVPTETPQLSRPKPITLDIPEVIKLAAAGGLRVPRFQRSFVWDADDIRKLFDSIWRGFPIGTLLLWKHKAPADHVAFGPVAFDVPRRTDAYWLVDGQQRVTSIVGVLAKAPPASDTAFELSFDLRRGRVVSARRRGVPSWWLPLRVAHDTPALLSWLRQNDVDFGDAEIELAMALGGALRDYQIPAYVVERDDDQLLREVFDRINSAGKPIRRAQIFHALFARDTEPGSPAAVVAELARLGWGYLDESRVVQSLLAIRGGDVIRDIHDEFASDDDLADWYEQTERALVRSIGLLHRQGVPHLRLAPSALVLPVLAAFFHLHPEPDPWNERLLALWVWRAWIHGLGGTSGQTPALRAAVRCVHPQRGQPDEAPSEYDAVRALLESVPNKAAPPVELSRFRTDSSVGRLGLLALASLRPRDPETGKRLDLATRIEKHGVHAVTELVLGARSNLAGRGFWPVGSRPTGREPADVLASHAIDEVAAQALRDDNVDSFLQRRGTLLAQVVGNFLASRIDASVPIRPPLADLVVPDDEAP
jgi:hypothetical protein